MFENKNFQSWFKENTPKEGLSETMTFSKQFVKDTWDNGYCVGYNKAKEEMQAQIEKMKADYDKLLDEKIELEDRLAESRECY